MFRIAPFWIVVIFSGGICCQGFAIMPRIWNCLFQSYLCWITVVKSWLHFKFKGICTERFKRNICAWSWVLVRDDFICFSSRAECERSCLAMHSKSRSSIVRVKDAGNIIPIRRWAIISADWLKSISNPETCSSCRLCWRQCIEKIGTNKFDFRHPLTRTKGYFVLGWTRAYSIVSGQLSYKSSLCVYLLIWMINCCH